MIIGSGLLAQAFTPAFIHRDDVCIYAAGVSNSGCNEVLEFVRERERLTDALLQAEHVSAFVYFGTCSVVDPEMQHTPHVKHKLEMENVVRKHPQNLILRLPQVAGKTPNPHTLLNFLYARISQGKSFNLWSKAKRNIIDVVDVEIIAKQLIENNSTRNKIINIANIASYEMVAIVAVMEHIVGRRAVYNVVEYGSDYCIDTGEMLEVLEKVNVKFGGDYLEKIITKYYRC